jgi:hypothetical protein
MSAEFLRQEPLPELAYAVQPCQNESFGSWLDRLCGHHEANRIDLWRHLNITVPAKDLDLDLWSSHFGSSLKEPHNDMLSKLAIAVRLRVPDLARTLLKCSRKNLLPPMLRHFGCPRCWQEDIHANRDMYIRKKWLLRLCWCCDEHELPLVELSYLNIDIPAWDEMFCESAKIASLLKTDLASPPSKYFLKSVNARVLTDPEASMPTDPAHLIWLSRRETGAQRYIRKLSQNQFHHSTRRISLLAEMACAVYEKRNDFLPAGKEGPAQRFVQMFQSPILPSDSKDSVCVSIGVMPPDILQMPPHILQENYIHSRHKHLTKSSAKLSKFSARLDAWIVSRAALCSQHRRKLHDLSVKLKRAHGEILRRRNIMRDVKAHGQTSRESLDALAFFAELLEELGLGYNGASQLAKLRAMPSDQVSAARILNLQRKLQAPILDSLMGLKTGRSQKRLEIQREKKST